MVFIISIPFSVRAADWNQFRGPNGAGSSAETGLPVKWGKDQNIRWKAELPGRGLSGVVVGGGRVFVTACDGPDQKRLLTLCFDATTGKKLWQRSIWATGGTHCHPKTCMAAPTPVTDGANVYALFGTADLVAYDAGGNLLWYRSLTGDYPSITNQVGMASSPVLAAGMLVVPMENVGESFIAGIDLKTGKNRWKTERPRDINWVTPAVRVADKATEIIFQGTDELIAYDLETGKSRWSYSGEAKLGTIPSPVVNDKNEVLVPSDELIALKPGAINETPTVLWKSSKLAPKGYPTTLYYQGRIYSINSFGVMTCASAEDGKILWEERAKGAPISASPVACDGKIYVPSEKGTTTVFKAGDQAEILATNDLGDEFLATPAISGRCIYLRSDKWLYCIGDSTRPPAPSR
jgi:outer membrane protein assembly factor BamB